MGSWSLLNGRESGGLWAGWVAGAWQTRVPTSRLKASASAQHLGRLGGDREPGEQGPDLPDEGKPAMQL